MPKPTRQWLLAGAGLLMFATAGALVWSGRTPVAKVTPPPAPAAGSVAPSLYVQHDGPALHLHWNPHAPAVRDAGHGVLSITDGAHESRLDLDAGELQSGTASYWPESRDVSFRLEVAGAPAATVRAPADLAESVPPPAPARTVDTPRKPAAPVRRIKAAHARAAVEPDDTPPPKHASRSRWSRAVGKIPLLRRLRKHRD